jgi:hypothetical protein
MLLAFLESLLLLHGSPDVPVVACAVADPLSLDVFTAVDVPSATGAFPTLLES